MIARYEEYDRERAYRIYVTKSLQLIPQSKYITVEFAEALNPNNIEDRSGEDIAIDVIKNAGLTFGDKG